MHWYRAIAEYAELGQPYVIATVLATDGSAPRPRGSKMVVTATGVDDTIGGGQFEWLVIERARALLQAGHSQAAVHHFPLAAAATQCCGGSVTVLLEAFAVPAVAVVVFGGGHVGRRVVRLLNDLPVSLRWLDVRAAIEHEGSQRCQQIDDPVALLSTLDTDTELLILTHDHQLDFELVQAALERGFARIGLIGSTTKWARFRDRLERAGLTAAQLQRVRCPVGDARISGKEPMAIAVAIVAELLEQRGAALTTTDTAAPLRWRQIKQSLLQGESDA